MNMSWSKWGLFRDDVAKLGGGAAAAAQGGFLLSTFTGWHDGSRIPFPISRPGIAVALGFLDLPPENQSNCS